MLNLSSKSLKKKFYTLRSTYNMRGFADLMVEIFQTYTALLKAKKPIPPEFAEYYNHVDVFSYVTLQELSKHNGKRALKYIEAIVKLNPKLPQMMFHIYYMLGISHYVSKNFQQAEENLKAYLDIRKAIWHDSDEIALFYFGNTFAFKHEFANAKSAYEQCLKMKKSFTEAAENLEIINSIMNDLSNEKLNIERLKKLNQYAEKSFLEIDENDEAACFNIPIFINARDRLGLMKNLIDWLLDSGYTNIIILDNNSTYPPLLEYYKSLNGDKRVKVIRINKNVGFKSIWQIGILEYLDIRTPYVYTDPDVIPIDSCPKNVVQQLLKILKRNTFIKKVGLGLVFEDITFFNKEKIKVAQNRFYATTAIDKDVYYSQVDTTFALYCNCRHYNLRFSCRTLGDLMVKHMPWYFDYDNLPEDEQYYLEHSDNSSTTNNALRKSN